MAVNAAGAAAAAWSQEVDSSHNVLQAAIRPAGGSWGGPQQVSAAPDLTSEEDEANRPRLVVDGTGAPTVVWQQRVETLIGGGPDRHRADRSLRVGHPGRHLVGSRVVRRPERSRIPGARRRRLGYRDGRLARRRPARPPLSPARRWCVERAAGAGDPHGRGHELRGGGRGPGRQRGGRVGRRHRRRRQPGAAPGARLRRRRAVRDRPERPGRSGTAGTPVAYSVAAVDAWSAVTSTSWSFGDGATASGASVSHTYAGAGTYAVSVTVTDAVGNARTRTGSTVVAAEPVVTPPVVTPKPGSPG